MLDLIDHKPHLKVPKISYQGVPDADMLAAAIADTFDRFKYAVEHEGVWKQLYDPGREPAHESRHQALFRLLASLSFEALGIKALPAADHGSGPTDLTLVLRDAVQVVEFKKDYNLRRLVHGLTVQLPAYMKSAMTQAGAYMVMCHERSPEEVSEMLEEAKAQINTEVNLALFIGVVDCRPQKSASRASQSRPARRRASGSVNVMSAHSREPR